MFAPPRLCEVSTQETMSSSTRVLPGLQRRFEPAVSPHLRLGSVLPHEHPKAASVGNVAAFDSR
jgi:hypothetical protein